MPLSKLKQGIFWKCTWKSRRHTDQSVGAGNDRILKSQNNEHNDDGHTVEQEPDQHRENIAAGCIITEKEKREGDSLWRV